MVDQKYIDKNWKMGIFLDLESCGEKATDVGQQQLQTNYKEKAWG